MKTIGYFICVVCLILTGCQTPPPKTLTNKDIVTPLTGTAPMAVRCSPEVWHHQDEMRVLGLSIPFETGQVFVSAFNGTKADQPVIDIKESHLANRLTDAGLTGIFTYEATVILHSAGKDYELKAATSRSVHGFESVPTSVQIVVETVVADLKQKIKERL